MTLYEAANNIIKRKVQYRQSLTDKIWGEKGDPKYYPYIPITKEENDCIEYFCEHLSIYFKFRDGKKKVDGYQNPNLPVEYIKTESKEEWWLQCTLTGLATLLFWAGCPCEFMEEEND